MPPRLDATKQRVDKEASVAAAAHLSAAPAPARIAPVPARTATLVPRSSWKRSILIYGCVLPILTLVALVTVPVAYKWLTLPRGDSFALITRATVVHQPPTEHSRWRALEYVDKYDRFFFQWWNFLIYDAETHDHWTLVYHTAAYSSAASFPAYASATLVHRQRSAPRDVAHEAVPLASVRHENDFDLYLRLRDGSEPYHLRAVDDDTYECVGSTRGTHTASGQAVRWNVTFHRVHGAYTGVDNEEGNKDSCAIVSTLFGFHSKVSGWIEEGDAGSAAGVRRFEFGAESAQAQRYRAYAAGSWGCQLPSGSPPVRYPWTWLWMVIPGDSAASRPDIGLAMGTALFQTNHSLVGDLYGGFVTAGVGNEHVSASFATLHHGARLEVPLSKTSSDGSLRRFELGLSEWANTSDTAGPFTLPLRQSYDVVTRRYRFQLRFESHAEEYFRCPVVTERAHRLAAASESETDTRRAALQLFSDYRAVGVKTHVTIWQRSRTPEEADAAAAAAATAKHKGAPRKPTPGVAQAGASSASRDSDFSSGAWDRVVYDGEVSTMNALEYAYESPVSDEVFAQFVKQPQLS